MKCNSCGEEFNSCTSCDSCVSTFNNHQDGMFITAEEYKQLKNTERFIELIFG